MALANVKCPNCGASIQLDSDRDEGFCSYCGSKVKVQEAISKVKIDKSGEVENFIKIAEGALESNNGKEAYDYANKVLEVDSTNSTAWTIKMKALDFMGTVKVPRLTEIKKTGETAIRLSGDNADTKKDVYTFFLAKVNAVLTTNIKVLLDTDAIKRLYEANVQLHPMSASKDTLNSDTIADMVLGNIQNTLQLFDAVPQDFIKSDNLAQIHLKNITKSWIDYSNALNTRFNVYGTAVNDDTANSYRNILNILTSLLPETEKANYSREQIKNEQKGACYIATAVYGSYDAPQVKVLRQYRDNVLAQSIPGRAFIKTYYALSPRIARWLRNAQPFNGWVRSILDKWVNHLSK